MVGLNPEFAHETMSGLTFTHAVAQTLWHGKLFHIDLNAQRIGKFDQDFRFGSEGIRDAFYLVKLLEDSGWDGMRHFDAHAYRTEDADGVWDFARGCMRTYLILAREGPALPRRRRDPGRAGDGEGRRAGRADARPAGWAATPSTRSGAAPYDVDALAAQGYGHERLDQLVDRAAARRPLTSRCRWSLGVDSSTQATQGRGARRRHRRAAWPSGRAPHPPTTPPRSEQDPAAWWDGVRGRVSRRPARATVGGDRRSPASSTAWSCSTPTGDVLRPAKLWNDTESAPDADWLVDQLGRPAAWADGVRQRARSPRSRSRSCAWLRRQRARRRSRGCATVLLPHDWLTLPAHRRGSSPTAATRRAPATGRRPTGAYRFDLLALVDGDARLGRRGARRCSAPRDARAGDAGRGAVVGARHRRQHGRRARPRACGPATSPSRSGRRAPSSRSATRRPPTRRAPSPGFADATGRFLPLVCTLNATQGHRRRRPPARRRRRRARRPRPGRPRRAPAGSSLVPYLDGERTPNRPDATGVARRAPLRRRAGEQLARAAFEGVVCGLLDGLDALGPPEPRHRVDERAHRARRRRRPVGGLPADRGRPRRHDILLPDGDEHVAAGACVQAAAVLHGTTPEDVAAHWRFGTGWTQAPVPGVDRAGIRARYAEVRQ